VFRILIVDDSATDVFVFREALKSLGRPCTVDWLNDGSGVFDFLCRRGIFANTPKPDLILLDVNMPGASGLEILSEIKNDPELGAIPVVMLSSSTSPADVRTSYLSHANGYLQKPSSLQNLMRMVRAIEAFWMEVAILPSGDNGPERTRQEQTRSAGFAGLSRIGREIAVNNAEEKAKAIPSEESVVGEMVSTAREVGCQDHCRLLDEFGAAVRELLRLHEDQFRALIHGDVESNRFDLLIHMANERKQLAKYAYIRHVESHGCANIDALNQTRA
jgi:two-component system, chemotaxis family, response regulator Rcp1